MNFLGRRALCSAADSLRVLGLGPKASEAEIKNAWRQLAKKWHPDRHMGSSKAHAEEQFKAGLKAYETLSTKGSEPAGRAGRTPGSAGMNARHHAQGATSSNNYWGTRSQFGEASRAGYNPYKGYMGFHADNRHWYADTANAAKREDQARMVRSWVGLSLFALGLWACTHTATRDSAAKQRGELVDAWFNQSSRRWEKPQPHMLKDPFLSSLIHLKPPDQVYNASPVRPNKRKTATTLDGSKVDAAYRAREQGMRG